MENLVLRYGTILIECYPDFHKPDHNGAGFKNAK